MTARELLEQRFSNGIMIEIHSGDTLDIIEAMDEFAEHRISEVKNQILKEVYDNIEYLQTLEIDEFECITIENLEIILNNIK